MSMLLDCIRRSDVQGAQAALDAGVDPNAFDDAGHSALCEAASRNQMDTVKRLLRHGAGVNIRQPDGRRPLTEAAFRGALDIVQLLLEHGADIDAGGHGNGSALFWATCADQLAVVCHLLSMGCDVDQPADEGNAPLQQVAANQWPQALSIAQELIQHGADVDRANLTGVTALMRSAASGNIEIAQLLLQSGANPMAITNRHETTMVFACRAYREHPEMVPLLIQYGAAPDVKDQYNVGALRLAASQGNADTVRALLVAGIDVDGYPDEPTTPLQAAASAGQLDSVNILIECGADIDRQGNGGMASPLLECLLRHRDDVARRLIEAGADINQQGMDGATPLLYALGYLDHWIYERSTPPKPNQELIQLMLEKGADPSVSSASNQTALDLARQTKNTRLIGLIKKYQVK